MCFRDCRLFLYFMMLDPRYLFAMEIMSIFNSSKSMTRSRLHWRTSPLDPVSRKDVDLRGISRDRWHHDIGIVNGKGQNRLKKQVRHDESKQQGKIFKIRPVILSCTTFHALSVILGRDASHVSSFL